ncbi:MAG: hypothetical protein LLG06_19520 [Desulfobacteraceae bacterium]|nr:hypothetical protein [Desulfobacteraceae bacterium]
MISSEERNCEFEGKQVLAGEMVCSSSACMICRDGKLEGTSKIPVL